MTPIGRIGRRLAREKNIVSRLARVGVAVYDVRGSEQLLNPRLSECVSTLGRKVYINEYDIWVVSAVAAAQDGWIGRPILVS